MILLSNNTQLSNLRSKAVSKGSDPGHENDQYQDNPNDIPHVSFKSGFPLRRIRYDKPG